MQDIFLFSTTYVLALAADSAFSPRAFPSRPAFIHYIIVRVSDDPEDGRCSEMSAAINHLT